MEGGPAIVRLAVAVFVALAGLIFVAGAQQPAGKTATRATAGQTTTKPAAKKPTKVTNKSGAARKTTTARRRRPVHRLPPVTPQQREAAIVDVNNALNAAAELNGAFEPFDNSAALVPFYERLYRLKNLDGPAVRVLHYGDSHTASDDWAAVLRQSFQAEFGDGGPGFAMPGKPFPGYRRYDVSSNSSRGWVAEGTMKRRGDGMHGLGGVSITARRVGETVTLEASGEQAELYLLQQPGGGNLDVWLDGAYHGTIKTRGELKPDATTLPGQPGNRRYRFRTSSYGPVRLLGSVVQNARGVTWETLGINGAQVSLIAEWEQSALVSQFTARDPAMIVLAYGTNEANMRSWDPNSYEAVLRGVIQRLRILSPSAAILLVGPPDCKVRSTFTLTQVVEIQRRVAYETNCAFWSWRDRMGGPGAIRNWLFAGMAQSDMIHFSRPGYQLVGKTLFQDLMHVYERFVGARMEAVSVAAREDQ